MAMESTYCFFPFSIKPLLPHFSNIAKVLRDHPYHTTITINEKQLLSFNTLKA
jgi:hypothetical protein